MCACHTKSQTTSTTNCNISTSQTNLRHMRHGHGPQPQRAREAHRESSGRAAAATSQTTHTGHISAHGRRSDRATRGSTRLRTSHLVPVLVTTSPDSQVPSPALVFPLSAGLAAYLQSRASRRLSLYSLGRGRLQSQQSLYCCTRTHTLFPLHSRAHHGEARAAPPSVLVAGRTKLSCRALASTRALCAATSQLTHGCCCRCCCASSRAHRMSNALLGARRRSAASLDAVVALRRRPVWRAHRLIVREHGVRWVHHLGARAIVLPRRARRAKQA